MNQTPEEAARKCLAEEMGDRSPPDYRVNAIAAAIRQARIEEAEEIMKITSDWSWSLDSRKINEAIRERIERLRNGGE